MDQYLHSAQLHPVQRLWYSSNCTLSTYNFMYPVFIIDEDDAVQPIESMPNVFRFGLNKIRDHLDPLVKKGLSSILVFGVIDHLTKDSEGINADSKHNPVIKAIPKLREWFPDLIIACDVCLCTYTTDGHCGIVDNINKSIQLKKSIERIATIALNYAKAGAHIVAPSDMMDGRVKAIKQKLIDYDLENRVSILSYSIKTASSFYGPFRKASGCKIAFGNRENYQLPIASTELAMRAVKRDLHQGADMVMVKPALLNLDLIKLTKENFPNYLLFAYQVSGEYSMLMHAAKTDDSNFQAMLLEVITSIRRAGKCF